MGDHGEAFGEHGQFIHDAVPYERGAPHSDAAERTGRGREPTDNWSTSKYRSYFPLFSNSSASISNVAFCLGEAWSRHQGMTGSTSLAITATIVLLPATDAKSSSTTIDVALQSSSISS